MTHGPPGPAATTSKNSPLVYIVDDEKLVADVVEAVLRLKNYRTRLFLDPREAWTVIPDSEPKPDVLLTDFVMDGMNGMELIQHCKNRIPTLKTILYSGTVDQEILQEYPVRPDGFMSKPFLPKVLLETVRQVLSG